MVLALVTYVEDCSILYIIDNIILVFYLFSCLSFTFQGPVGFPGDPGPPGEAGVAVSHYTTNTSLYN